MINPKLMQFGAAALSILKVLFVAIIGGAMVAGMQRCNTQPPVVLTVTNQQYEKQIADLAKGQDSIFSVLPSITESQKYMSDRYRKPSVRTGD